MCYKQATHLQADENLSPLEAIQLYARSDWEIQRLAYIRSIGSAVAGAGWQESQVLLPLLQELSSLPDTTVRQALSSQLTPVGAHTGCLLDYFHVGMLVFKTIKVLINCLTPIR